MAACGSESTLISICGIPRQHIVRQDFPHIARSILLLLQIFLLPFILGLTLAWAQDASTGALRGSVLDAQGAAVTNADIVAICVETGVRYHTATDSSGRFLVDLLPPGGYSARAEVEGLSLIHI